MSDRFYAEQKAFGATLTGVKEAERLFVELPAGTLKLVKPLIAQAERMLTDALKSSAPRQSGLLAAALGGTSVKTYGGRTLFAAVGVRRGFRRAITRTARGRLRFRGQKASDASEGEAFRNPVKYLHLVIGGRKAVSVIHKKALYDQFSGRYLGQSVAAAAPNPFVDRAFAETAPAVVAMVEAGMGDAVGREAQRYLFTR